MKHNGLILIVLGTLFFLVFKFIGLTKKQQQQLHREVGKENWGYQEIKQRAVEIKKGM